MGGALTFRPMDTTTTDTSTQPEGTADTRQRRGLMRRAIDFARRRPVTTLAVGAGLALLGGAEVAGAALAGGAVVALFSQPEGARLRGDLRARVHALMERRRRRMNGRAEDVAPPPSEPPAARP